MGFFPDASNIKDNQIRLFAKGNSAIRKDDLLRHLKRIIVLQTPVPCSFSCMKGLQNTFLNDI